MKITFDDATIELNKSGKSYRATMGSETVEVDILRATSGQLELLIDGEHVAVYVSSDNAKRWVTINGRTYMLTKPTNSRKSGHGHHHAAGELTAPMPGQVRSVSVSEGDTVMKGQTLLTIEAMKMEIRIQAPFDGTVNSLVVKVGQTVEREQILVMLER